MRTRFHVTPCPLAILVAVGLVFAGLSDASGQENSSAIGQAKALSRAFRQAANRATPSVVTVVSTARPRELSNLPANLRQLIPKQALENSQVGSGVVIGSDGIVLTNNHVVQGAEKIVVRLQGGKEIAVKEVLRDAASDLAVLRVDTRARLTPARLGDSDRLEIGDWVIAIGSPFELEATVSAGIISGKGRGIRKIKRGQLLQTDAAINPGNSGGPLVNLDGEVIGINTAIATNNGGYQGIGFAIPINRAKWISRELRAHGKVRRAYLGIEIADIDAELGQQLGYPARHGVWVRSTVDDGPADLAGIEEGDVIVDFAGARIRSTRDLQDAVEQKPIGSRQRVAVERERRTKNFTVVVRSYEEISSSRDSGEM